ncbi:hypothetical protein Tco_0731656 [Tanacetum coccineum]
MSKQRFASQVDVNKNLLKPVTQHYLPKKTESCTKPDHMIASSSSRNSSKNMPRFSSNDMVHNHYLFQSTADDSKPKPRSNNQTSRSLPCVFNANHDACITKLLNEVNSHAKIQFHKTRNINKPVAQKSHTQKPGRQIVTRHRFSPNKTVAVDEKTSPRSDLRWKPTGRIFKSVGLRWIPIGKLFDSCTGKDDSEPTHGSNVDIPNIHECKQTLDLSAGTSLTGQQKQRINFSSEGTNRKLSPEPGESSTKHFHRSSLIPLSWGYGQSLHRLEKRTGAYTQPKGMRRLTSLDFEPWVVIVPPSSYYEYTKEGPRLSLLSERISKKRTKNKAKNDKTGHGMEKHGKDKVKSKPKSTPTNPKSKSEEK